MAKQVTSKNQEDIDAMIRAADRGELIHHTEAAVRRDPGAPLLTDEQAASLMAQSMTNWRSSGPRHGPLDAPGGSGCPRT